MLWDHRQVLTASYVLCAVQAAAHTYRGGGTGVLHVELLSVHVRPVRVDARLAVRTEMVRLIRITKTVTNLG